MIAEKLMLWKILIYRLSLLVFPRKHVRKDKNFYIRTELVFRRMMRRDILSSYAIFASASWRLLRGILRSQLVSQLNSEKSTHDRNIIPCSPLKGTCCIRSFLLYRRQGNVNRLLGLQTSLCIDTSAWDTYS